MQKLFEGVFLVGKMLATENLVPGKRVYDEKLIKEGGKEYRTWDAFRSKLAGAIKKGLKNFPFKKDSKVLYLGASTGTTPSHLSDVCSDGEVYAIEISAHCMKKLLQLCEKRENLIPILGDANKPQEYQDVGEVDAVYQDVAQPNQAEILIKNSDVFLKKDGIAMIAIKSQSIDVVREPEAVFKEVVEELEKKFEVLEQIKLEPFDKDHLFVVLRKK